MAKEPRLYSFVLTGLNHPQVMDLKPGLNQVGRNPTNDFRIYDATVSSFHCELEVANDSVTVRDLSTTNGTFIDDRPVADEGVIRPGQVLRLGHAEFRLDREEARVEIPDLALRPSKPLPPLPAGAVPCFKHPAMIATVRCTKCGRAYCGDCVKPIRRRGGKPKRFCHVCLGQCEPIPGVRKKRKKLSFVGKITQTIRILWK